MNQRGTCGVASLLGIVVALSGGCGGGDAPHTSRDHVIILSAPSRPPAGIDARAKERTVPPTRDRSRAFRHPHADSVPAPRRAAVAAPGGAAGTAPKPPIVQRPIPFGPRREREMRTYARRHYGIDDYRLRDPRVIVEHYTAGATAAAAIATFTPDFADSELHELPGLCAHFVIDRDGTIYELVPLTIMCRHTVGLNYTAIGIEHAGFSDQDVLDNRRQLASSLALTRWLRCRYAIRVSDVIGHNESLTSPYHSERVAAVRSQTHADWTRDDMNTYRAKLSALGC